MLKRMLGSLFWAALFASIGLAQAQSRSARVEVQDPYVRAVPSGLPNSASFMQLHNHDARDHALVGAESPAAKVVELHAHRLVDGMMQMRPVEKVVLPAGATTSLKPGGLHLMLIGLRRPLVPGDAVPLTLVFEDGFRLELSAPVRKLRMHMQQRKDPGSMDHGKHHGGGQHTPQERYRESMDH